LESNDGVPQNKRYSSRNADPRSQNIKNTLIYTQLIDFENDDYTCKTAQTIKEAMQLVEAGFEYVTEMESYKLFRKRK